MKMDEWVDESGWMSGWMDGWMDGWMNGWMEIDGCNGTMMRPLQYKGQQAPVCSPASWGTFDNHFCVSLCGCVCLCVVVCAFV